MAWASFGFAQAGAAPTTQPVRQTGTIQAKAISESSGLIASRQFAGVLWTHNDGGNEPKLYAIDRNGKLLADFRTAFENNDWEDIAIDANGRLYIGDIGNNGGKQKQISIFRVKEPNPSAPRFGGSGRIFADRVWRLRYPAEPFDAEALFVLGNHGYVISKLFTGERADVYRFSLEQVDEPVVLERVATLPVRAPVTAADLSADGKYLAVLTVLGLSVFEINGDVSAVGSARAQYIPLVRANLEACTFVADGVLATTEAREIFLFTMEDKAAGEGSR